MRTLLAAAAAALLLAAPASARIPDDWVGMIVDGPMFTSAVDVPTELDTMRRSRVGSVRFAIYWHHVQPDRGVPPDFADVDRFVERTARRGFSLLPVVLGTPHWARTDPSVTFSAPTAEGRAGYARFLTTLVGRYGPDGSFWREHPGIDPRPIRRWQIWNEPNGPKFWHEQPGIPAYVELLKAAAPAVRAADPGAHVVLAGLFGRAWQPLAEIYAHGGGGLFDAVAVNPFTDRVRNLLLIIRRVRTKMRANGDARLPVIATEISYPSAKGRVSEPFGFEVTEQGQARRVRQAIRALARARHRLNIAGFFWSTWMSYDRSPTSSFDYAGLRRAEDDAVVVAKPAFFAFRRVARRLTR